MLHTPDCACYLCRNAEEDRRRQAAAGSAPPPQLRVRATRSMILGDALVPDGDAMLAFVPAGMTGTVVAETWPRPPVVAATRKGDEAARAELAALRVTVRWDLVLLAAGPACDDPDTDVPTEVTAPDPELGFAAPIDALEWAGPPPAR